MKIDSYKTVENKFDNKIYNLMRFLFYENKLWVSVFCSFLKTVTEILVLHWIIRKTMPNAETFCKIAKKSGFFPFAKHQILFP